MRIVFLVRSLGCGGAERQLAMLAGRLAARHEVHVLTFYDGDDFYRPLLDGSDVHLRSLGKRGRWDAVGFLRRFIRTVRDVRPDVVYAFMNSASILSAVARIAGAAPRIVWGVRASNMDWRRYGLIYRMVDRAEAWLSPVADLAVANSEAGRTHAIANGFRGTVVVVPNGIDTDRFAPAPQAGEALRLRLGIPAVAPVIGIVGRHDPMKGYEPFLEAAGRLLATHQDVWFLAVGDGPPAYSAGLRRLASEQGLDSRLVWASAVEQMVPYYAAMTLMTSASVFGEGFSNAIGEAMSCGVPCVATTVGDSAAIVGDTGWTVPPGDSAALVTAWTRALAEPPSGHEARRSAARRRIQSSFTDDTAALRTEAILEEVCRR